MEALMNASADQVNSVPGVGRTIAEAVVSFFAEPQSLAHRAAATDGLPMVEAGAVAMGGPLSGKSYVLTGPAHPEPPEGCEPHRTGRGHVTGSVSKKTDVLVAEREAGASWRRQGAWGSK